MTTWTQQSPALPSWDMQRPSITTNSTPIGLLLVLTRFIGSAVDNSSPFSQVSQVAVSFSQQTPVAVGFIQSTPQSVTWNEKEAV